MVDSNTVEKLCEQYWNAGIAVGRWNVQDDEQREVVRQRMTAALEGLEREGYRLCPPGHVLLPQSHQEAQVMNCISERFLPSNS